MERGWNMAVPPFLPTDVMKLRRPHAGVSVLSTSDPSPTLVDDSTMSGVA